MIENMVTTHRRSIIKVEHLKMLARIRTSAALDEEKKTKHIAKLFVQGHFEGTDLTTLLTIYRALENIIDTEPVADNQGQLVVYWTEESVVEDDQL